MIPIVVLSLILCALTVDYLVLRLPLGRRILATADPNERAIHVARTHMWLVPEASGLARVGVDEVASLLLGHPEKIEWTPARRIARGAPLAFVVVGGRRLTLRSPVDGEVVEENSALTACPSQMASSPLEAGWLVRLRPTGLAAQLRQMRTGKKLHEWSRQEMARLRAFVLDRLPKSNLVGATAMDGGPLDPNMARHLDDGAFADAVRLVFAEDGVGPSQPSETETRGKETAP